MNEKEFEIMCELEDIGYQFEIINRLIMIIQHNYYNKNDVDYTKLGDYYDLCIGYKDVLTLLDTVGKIAYNSKKRFENTYNILFTKKEIQSE